MNKSSEKLVISIDSDHEKMIHDLLVLFSNSTFHKSKNNVTVNVSGTIHFDFNKEETKIILEPKN